MSDPVAIVTAAGVELDRIGWTTADPFDDVRASIDARVADGRSGGLGFTYADAATATTPHLTWDWARSIVVGLMTYLPDARTHTDGARVARFAESDHYEPLGAAIGRVADALRAEGHRAEPSIDDSRLVDRAVAHRAGLAWWGKSTMLLAPGLGPWFLIGCVVTDATFPPSSPMLRDCGTCSACVPACPTGALAEPGVLDARRCLAAVLQRPGPIPVELREAVGDRLYGCDDCLEACPPGHRLLEASTASGRGVDPRRVLSAPAVELAAEFDHFYLPARDVRWLRRNALVVLGNTGTEDDLVLLAGHLAHPDPVITEHARWAIGAIGGPVADAILAQSVEPIGK